MPAHGLHMASTEPTHGIMHKTKRQKLIAEALRSLLPMVPLSDFSSIQQSAGAGHLRHLPPSIATRQAITSHIRHRHTDYDQLLEEGYDRDSARHFVLDDMNNVLEDWGSSLRIDEND